MFGHHRTEVLVVGAGPVGLFTALALKQRGVNVNIVDEEWRPGARSYALALHPKSMEIFAKLGLGKEIQEQAYRVDRLLLRTDGRLTATLPFSAVGGDHPYLTILPQSTLEDLLFQRLEQLGVHVLWNQRVEDLQMGERSVVASIDELAKVGGGYAISTTEWLIERTIHTEADYVIGADGCHSTVRRALGFEHELLGPPDFFAVFEFECDIPTPHEACICVEDSTINVLWPLPNGRCRWSFQIKQDEHAATESRTKERLAVQIGDRAYPFVSERDLRNFLQTRAPWFPREIGPIHWSMIVRFERRLAEAFGRDRVWLLGDSAHMTGPAGVQSMNIGFREGFELAGILENILRMHGAQSQLAAFGQRQHDEWRWMLGLSGGLSPANVSDPWLAKNAKRLLPCIPASGDDLIKFVQPLGLVPMAPHPADTTGG